MKTLDEFVELFAEQFDETDASEITADKNFRDLDEWSSLIGLSVIAMIDEERPTLPQSCTKSLRARCNYGKESSKH